MDHNLASTIHKSINKRRLSAGGSHTSTAGAVTSLITTHSNQIILFGTFRSLARRELARFPLWRQGKTTRVPNGIILITFMLISAIAVSHNTYAVSNSLSLTIDSSTISLDISSLSSSGTFAKSNSSTISASTTNATGYTLSIAANDTTNPTKLLNGTEYLNSITEATTEASFSALAGTAYNNMWGYLPSKYCTNATDNNTCTTNTDFLPAPSPTGDILDVTDTANPNNTPNEYSLAIGARVDSSTKIGSYNNTFTILAVANAIPYTMTFIDSTVSNMPIDIDTTSMTNQVTIPSNTPAKNGYTFLGWCSVPPTVNASGTDTCSGTAYQPNGTATINQQSTSNDFTFYAMWGGNYTIKSVTYMQDFANMSAEKKGKIISTMETGAAYTLTDNRDNTIYHIAKLKDGNVWLLDNLAIDLVSLNLSALKGKTNASDIALEYLKGIRTGTTADQYPISAVSNQANFDYSSPRTVIQHKDMIPNNSSYGDGNNKVGGYYNFCATSAGSYCYTNGSEVGNATEDICPAGWRLPTADDNGDFQALLANYNTLVLYRIALSLPYSGHLSDGSQITLGETASYWSSTSINASYMNLSDTYGVAIALSWRPAFYTVRCLAK